jgi:hypothetical protein
MPGTAAAKPPGYRFTKIAALGDPAQGGGTLIDDFEPVMINDRGDVTFGADLSSPVPGNEGIFLAHKGKLSALALPGQTVPAGGVLDSNFHGPFEAALNDNGDVALDYYAAPFPADPTPFGTDVGIYRFAHRSNALLPVIVPYVTPAPGGGIFVGETNHPCINNRGIIAFGGMPTSIAVFRSA